MSNLDELGTKSVLKDGAFQEHEKLKAALWDHLVRLENNVLVLEDIVSFPGLHMMGSGRRIIDLMGQNLYEYTLLIVWRLWDDTDSRAITLKRLRRCLWDGVRDEYRESLKARFKAIKPDSRLRDIFSRARVIRHGRLAHIDEGYSFDESQRVVGVSISELRLATKFLSRYFNRLQFGVHSFFELAAFEHRSNGASTTVAMLEALMLRAPVVRRYDEFGPERWWRSWGQRLDPADINWLSRLRVRHGLASIKPLSD